MKTPHTHDNQTLRGARQHGIKALGIAMCLCGVLVLPAQAQPEKTALPTQPKSDATVPNVSTRSSSGLGPTSVLAAMDEDYRIGPNDVLEIEVEDAPELSGARRVTANGTFLMPYLGRLMAKGKTPEDLSQVIAQGLDQKYLVNPRVTVVVKQYNSRSFFIQGSVRNPGVYQIEGRPTLLELVTVAGGLADSHASTVFIIRKVKPTETENNAVNTETTTGSAQRSRYSLASDAATSAPDADAAKGNNLPQYTLIKANLAGLLRGNFNQNMFLEPGDVVNIPQTEMFFVAGEVNAAGAFALKEGTTLRQAIALAQGTNFKAALNRTVIFRENPQNGQREELHIDLGAVMSGKAEDQRIQANDIVMVANSKMKSIAAPLLSALGMQAVRLPIRY